MASVFDDIRFNILGDTGGTTKEIGKLANNLGRVAKHLESVREGMKDSATSADGFRKAFQPLFGQLDSLGETVKRLDKVMSGFGKDGEKDVQRLTKAVEGLSRQNLKAAQSVDLDKPIKAVTRFDRGILGATRSLYYLQRAFYTLKRAGSSLFSFAEDAMAFGETINLFETSLRKIGKEADDALEFRYLNNARKFQQDFTDALTLDPDATMNAQAIFGSISNAFGLLADDATAVSESFTMLGADMASLFNVEVEDMYAKLRSGLAGQVRPLRDLGIDITQASLAQTALNYGITDSITAMDQASKVQLRYLTIMDQSKISLLDMARTINAPANQMRVLSSQVALSSRSIGSMFIPALSAILPYANAAVMAVGRVAAAIAAFLGYETPTWDSETILPAKPIFDTVDFGEDIADGIGDVGDAIGGVGDRAGGAAQKVNELKATLFGFDKLNVLQEPTSSGGGGGGGGGGAGGGGGIGGGGGFGGGNDALSAALRKVNDGYLGAFMRASDQMSNKARELADQFEKAIMDFIYKVQNSAAYKTLSKLLDPAWDSLKAAGSYILDNLEWFLNGLAAIGAGKLVQKAAAGIGDAIEKIAGLALIKQLPGVASKLGAFGAKLAKAAPALGLAAGALTGLYLAIQQININKVNSVFGSIRLGAEDLSALKDIIAGPFVRNLEEVRKEFERFDSIGGAAQGAIDHVYKEFRRLGDLDRVTEEQIGNLRSTFDNSFKELKGYISEGKIFDAEFFDRLFEVDGEVNEMGQGIMDSVAGAWDTTEEKVVAIQERIEGSLAAAANSSGEQRKIHLEEAREQLEELKRITDQMTLTEVDVEKHRALILKQKLASGGLTRDDQDKLVEALMGSTQTGMDAITEAQALDLAHLEKKFQMGDLGSGDLALARYNYARGAVNRNAEFQIEQLARQGDYVFEQLHGGVLGRYDVRSGLSAEDTMTRRLELWSKDATGLGYDFSDISQRLSYFDNFGGIDYAAEHIAAELARDADITIRELARVASEYRDNRSAQGMKVSDGIAQLADLADGENFDKAMEQVTDFYANLAKKAIAGNKPMPVKINISDIIGLDFYEDYQAGEDIRKRYIETLFDSLGFQHAFNNAEQTARHAMGQFQDTLLDLVSGDKSLTQAWSTFFKQNGEAALEYAPELYAIMEALGGAGVQEFAHAVDANEDGEISMREFINAVTATIDSDGFAMMLHDLAETGQVAFADALSDPEIAAKAFQFWESSLTNIADASEEFTEAMGRVAQKAAAGFENDKSYLLAIQGFADEFKLAIDEQAGPLGAKMEELGITTMDQLLFYLASFDDWDEAFANLTAGWTAEDWASLGDYANSEIITGILRGEYGTSAAQIASALNSALSENLQDQEVTVNIRINEIITRYDNRIQQNLSVMASQDFATPTGQQAMVNAHKLNYQKKISGYASGGYPERGELFIMNEQGPEFLTSIGSRPAVVNQTQMHSGITEGVEAGMINAMLRTGGFTDAMDRAATRVIGAIAEYSGISIDGREISAAGARHSGYDRLVRGY